MTQRDVAIRMLGSKRIYATKDEAFTALETKRREVAAQLHDQIAQLTAQLRQNKIDFEAEAARVQRFYENLDRRAELEADMANPPAEVLVSGEVTDAAKLQT